MWTGVQRGDDTGLRLRSPVSPHLPFVWAEPVPVCRGHRVGTAPPPPGLRLPQPLPDSYGVSAPLTPPCPLLQELKPKSLDVRQEELGAMVDKEMAATSAAIEDAVQRIEVTPGCRGSSRLCRSRRGWA